MPSGKPINWPKFDYLIRKYLPNMSVATFRRCYLPSLTIRSIRSRAAKLGIKTRRRGRFVDGWHKSPKAINGRAHHRSSYELRYYLILDNDVDVVTYQDEPFSIIYKFRGVTRIYIPDILVRLANGKRRLIEVKPKRMLKWPKNAAKVKAAIEYCQAHNIEFVTITEEDLARLAPRRTDRRNRPS